MKNLIKKLFNTAGFHFGKINVLNSQSFQIVSALKSHDINLVFDIGANIGQFASELRRSGYKGRIVSFEPLPQAFEALNKLAHNDADWIIHPRCAVGNNIGVVEINVAENSVSSSILPMLDIHEKIAPQSKYTHKEFVHITTLDSILDLYIKPNDKLFIKVDTQGYEWSVLDGASKTLEVCKGVLLELSLIPLYEEQRLWIDFIKRLNLSHLHLYAIQPSFVDMRNGQTLQVDGLFFKLKNIIG